MCPLNASSVVVLITIIMHKIVVRPQLWLKDILHTNKLNFIGLTSLTVLSFVRVSVKDEFSRALG